MNTNSEDIPYLRSIVQSLPRILNQLDQNLSSPTHGCFDRDFWHYKTSDFACGRKQEAMLTLALLYNLPSSPIYQNEHIKNHIQAAVSFWTRLQASEGSFSEWYPSEHSFVTTAFSLYAVTETLIQLGWAVDSSVRAAIKKAADFLVKSTEFRVQNQQTGAIIALHNSGIVLKDDFYARAAKERLVQLANYQNTEGWLTEYGGPDIGYLSLAIDYLAKYWKASKNELAKSIALKAAEFVEWFLHPDGTTGGVYTSRNTEYLVPSGFETLPGEHCDKIAGFCRQGIEQGTLPHCATIDDRYLLYNGYTYVQAHLAAKKKIDFPSFKTPFAKDFPNCGLSVVSTPAYFFIVNTTKGGAFTIIDAKGNRVDDSGLFAHTDDEVLHSSYIGSTEHSSDVEKKSTRTIRLTGHLQPASNSTLSPAKNVMLRAFQLTLGKDASISRVVKEKLRDKVITPQGRGGVGFERTFTITPTKITITDTVTNAAAGTELIVGSKQPMQYVPSARFYVPADGYRTLPVQKKQVTTTRVLP